MGCTVFRGRGMTDVPGYDSAVLRVARSGAVEAYVTTPSMGQQPFKAMRRIVADKFGIDEARVHVSCADTETMPHGSGAFASRGLVSGGGALQRAAGQAIDQMKRFAALKLEVDPEDVVFSDGRFADGHNSNRFATFEEIADFAHSPSPNLPDGLSHGLQAAATFDTPGAATSAAMHIATVAVDTETGEVEILKYVVAEDCGTIADLDVVEGPDLGRGGAGDRSGAAGRGQVRRRGAAPVGQFRRLHDSRRVRGAGDRDRPPGNAVADHRGRLQGGGRERHHRRARGDRGRGDGRARRQACDEIRLPLSPHRVSGA